jgi:hypothetical protein
VREPVRHRPADTDAPGRCLTENLLDGFPRVNYDKVHAHNRTRSRALLTFQLPRSIRCNICSPLRARSRTPHERTCRLVQP